MDHLEKYRLDPYGDGKLMMDRRAEIKELLHSTGQERLTKAQRMVICEKYRTSYSTVCNEERWIWKNGENLAFAAPSTKKHVWERDKGICQYCGKDEGDMIIEHVIGRFRGGTGKSENLVLACQSCNMRKRESVWLPRNFYMLAFENREWGQRIIREATKDFRHYLSKVGNLGQKESSTK